MFQLVVHVLKAERRDTADKNEPYLVLHGVDMEGCSVAPLRLWRFSEDDVDQGNTYIIRGLKVGEEVQWDDEQWKWVPRQNGVRALESTVRTALEDVTGVEDIERCFQGW